MDQVKKFLNILKAQRFWVICGLITILPLGGWFAETNSMRATTKARSELIDGKFKDTQALQSKQDPPNETSHTGMDKLIAELKRRVGEAWGMQYDQQTNLLVWPEELGPDFLGAVKPLNPIEKVKFPTAPQDEIKVHLRERYRNYIHKELPELAEIINARWTVTEASISSMGGMGGMPGDMGGMASSGFGGGGFAGMGAAAMSGSGMMPGSSMPGDTYGSGMPGTTMIDPVTGQPIVDDSTVLWNSQDQTMIMARYDWGSHQDKVPRTLDVLYAQEDLWILTTLMHIIKETNQGASARYDAVVKEIQYISIGAHMGGTLGRITPVGMNAMGGMAGYGSEMGMMGMSGDSSAMMGADMASGDMSGAMPGMDGGTAGSSAGMMPGGMPGDSSAEGYGMMMGPRDPAHNRYVDFDYKPVAAETVRSAAESDAQSEEQAYLLVAKRIPIRLGLTVDQRRLNRFITACGNSKLMVEVRQVRFNRQSGPGSTAAMGGYGGMMGAMMGSGGMPGDMGALSAMGGGGGFGGGGFGGGGFGGGGGGYGSTGTEMSSSGAMPGDSGGYGTGGYNSQNALNDVNQNDKPVEVLGVVYIYNPVDVKKLRLEEAAAEAAPAAEPTGGDATAPTAGGA